MLTRLRKRQVSASVNVVLNFDQKPFRRCVRHAFGDDENGLVVSLEVLFEMDAGRRSRGGNGGVGRNGVALSNMFSRTPI